MFAAHPLMVAAAAALVEAALAAEEAEAVSVSITRKACAAGVTRVAFRMALVAPAVAPPLAEVALALAMHFNAAIAPEAQAVVFRTKEAAVDPRAEVEASAVAAVAAVASAMISNEANARARIADSLMTPPRAVAAVAPLAAEAAGSALTSKRATVHALPADSHTPAGQARANGVGATAPRPRAVMARRPALVATVDTAAEATVEDRPEVMVAPAAGMAPAAGTVGEGLPNQPMLPPAHIVSKRHPNRS